MAYMSSRMSWSPLFRVIWEGKEVSSRTDLTRLSKGGEFVEVGFCVSLTRAACGGPCLTTSPVPQWGIYRDDIDVRLVPVTADCGRINCAVYGIQFFTEKVRVEGFGFLRNRHRIVCRTLVSS